MRWSDGANKGETLRQKLLSRFADAACAQGKLKKAK